MKDKKDKEEVNSRRALGTIVLSALAETPDQCVLDTSSRHSQKRGQANQGATCGYKQGISQGVMATFHFLLPLFKELYPIFCALCLLMSEVMMDPEGAGKALER